VIEGQFEYAVRAKAVRFSHGDFGSVIQALDDTTGNQLLNPEGVEDELAVLTQGAGNLLHRLDAGPHDLATPFVEEFAGPRGRVVIPELLKNFLEQISADGLQVVTEQITEAEVLLIAEIVAAF
jgi:hypothetical protein